MSRSNPEPNWHRCGRVDLHMCSEETLTVKAQSLWVSHEGRWLIISSAPDEHSTHRKTHMFNSDGIDRIDFIYED